MQGGDVTFVSFWHSYVIEFLETPYLRQFLVRYYANVLRDARNRTNRSKRLAIGARIRPIHHRGVRHQGGACRTRRRLVEKWRLCGNLERN